MSQAKEIEFRTHFSCDNLEVVELENFARLTSYNLELAHSLLMLFKEQMHKYILDFKTSHEREEQLHLIHAIKGASRCIAAEGLASVAGDIEDLLRKEEKISEEIMNIFYENAQQVLHYIRMIETRNL